jgi:hypothetical protein
MTRDSFSHWSGRPRTFVNIPDDVQPRIVLSFDVELSDDEKARLRAAWDAAQTSDVHRGDDDTTSEVARVLLLHASFKASPEIQETDTPWSWECDGCSTAISPGGTGRQTVFSGLAAHQAAMLAEAGLVHWQAQAASCKATADLLWSIVRRARAVAGPPRMMDRAEANETLNKVLDVLKEADH